MFSIEDLDEFVNRLMDNAIKSNNFSQFKKGVVDLKKYLNETKMCDETYLRKLDKVVECSDELIALKKKMPSFDVMATIEIEEQKGQTIRKPAPQKKKTRPSYNPTTNNHRSHYVEVSSSSCGESSSYSNSCGGGTYRGC